MRRIGGYAMFLLLALPLVAQAQQKPSNSMHTRSAEIYLDRARQAAVNSERDELLNKALEVLMEGAESDAGNPKIWFMTGQAYARLGNAAGADSAFDRAESMYPEYAAEIAPERLNVWIASYNQGISALQAGDHAAAMAALEAADQVYRGRPEAALMLGSLRAQDGDLPGAEEAFRTALQITQGPASEDVDEADMAEWIEQEVSAADQLAGLLSQLGRSNDAIAVYESVLARHPGSSAIKADLAAELAAAGRGEEAAAMYEDLLVAGELSDIDWFNAGVRLYSAEQPELAARAFRKSVELNPWSRDAWYNLGQALFAVSSAVESDRAAAAETERSTFDSRVTELNEELLAVAQRIRELDPAFRPALMMEAQARRTMSEMAPEATRREKQNEVVATLEEAEAMPFEISGIQTRIRPGEIAVTGRLTNLKLDAGQTVTLDFTLIGEGGEPVATQTVSVTAGEADSSTEFDFTIPTEATILGWTYSIAS